ncbi:hypothetical protein EDI_253100 [Entamoeba dispar SAW760]|uniref:RRM domain-containing protein n=1 Tax=Entamoeba dispar (strain ATCC PRA-260 / SAW760) TaxID=370354 RepID=B0EFB5_ENTDS|nr:uncharacterized protein EDI_253100 [Entamoeba dispar SAW760]EDR26845.1 hypothetical protein EDI_253100 [Entamoeba dispar SAW760]|eukprot:EDR26845.1 hypothetical protein EDI_253100 [Entamoeba dispar SAW760]
MKKVINPPSFYFRPSHCLLISNINKNNKYDDFCRKLMQYGVVVDLINNIQKNGTIQITYNDLREAEWAKNCLDGQIIDEMNIVVEYSLPLYSINNPRGILLNCNLAICCKMTHHKIDLSYFIKLFQKFGEIYSIWGSSSGKIFFVEYYKLQDHLNALKNISSYSDDSIQFNCKSIQYSPHQIDILMTPLNHYKMFSSNFFSNNNKQILDKVQINQQLSQNTIVDKSKIQEILRHINDELAKKKIEEKEHELSTTSPKEVITNLSRRLGQNSKEKQKDKIIKEYTKPNRIQRTH